MKILTKGEYFGQQDFEAAFNGILLSRYDYTVAKTAWHYHENPYFMYVLHGAMVDGNSRVTTPCPSGSLMFTNWQELHYGAKASDTAGGFHLEFERSWLQQNGLDLSLQEGSRLLENPQLHVLFAKLYREFMFRDHYSDLTVEVLVVQICEALSTAREGQFENVPDWINDLKELLHYDPKHLTLAYLSKQLDVHPVHISRAAPKYLATSLGEYIRQVKLKKALPLLLDSSHSLTAIAYDSGFADQSHFNRVFKSYFDMNPSAYRKNLLKK